MNRFIDNLGVILLVVATAFLAATIIKLVIA